MERIKEIVSELNSFTFISSWTFEKRKEFEAKKRELSQEFNDLLRSDEEAWKEANRYIDEHLIEVLL